MADQQIEIKLVLRSELEKQLAPIRDQLKQLDQVRLEQPRHAMQAFGRAMDSDFVSREANAVLEAAVRLPISQRIQLGRSLLERNTADVRKIP